MTMTLPSPVRNVRVTAGGVLPVPPTKRVITSADLTYLGCFRMPPYTNAFDTMFAYGGITGRVVNGQQRLFLYGNNPQLHDPVYEIADPGTYGMNYRTAPRGTLVTNWGDIYHGHRMAWDAQGNPIAIGYQLPAGLHWHEGHQLLYWTYFDSYNSTLIPYQNLGASSLDDPVTKTSTAYGPWRTSCVDGDGKAWIGATRGAFLTALPDGSMGTHGVYFVTKAAPWGPQLYAGAWPTTSTPSGPFVANIPLPDRYLTYYAMIGQIAAMQGTFTGSLRAFRRTPDLCYVWHPSVGGGIATEIDPVKNGGVGSWTSMDSIGGMTWIDLPDKHGVVFAVSCAGGPNADPAVCGTGHVWYRNTGQGTALCTHGCDAHMEIAGPVTDAAFPALMIYDPTELESVRAGSTVDYTVDPSTVMNVDTLRTAPVTTLGNGKTLRGVYFNPSTRTLYVQAPGADDSVAGLFTSLMHVFQVA